jgi:predicted DNA-binding transcriptional regulator AlpA
MAIDSKKLDHSERALTSASPEGDLGALKLERFLDIAQVEELTRIRRKDIYKRIARGAFPRQVLIKSKPDAKKYKSIWLGSEIAQWQQALVAERDRLGATGEAEPLPSRLQPPARARAQITARKTIAERRTASAPTPGTRHRSKGKHHATVDVAAPRIAGTATSMVVVL